MARERSQLGWKTFLLLMAFALGIGGVCRFTDLAKKPMHTDEAILALKTKEFWNTGFFKYDPKDYHGPFLHHAAKIVSMGKGWTAESFNESQSRWVIAFFGMGILLLPLLLVDVLGRTGAFFASLLMAVSPMMTYYSRYYIMEVPFVFLTGLLMISLWRWSQSRNFLWLLLGGISLGFMHATKETFVLNLGAMFAGWFAVKIFGGSYNEKLDRYSFSESKGGASVLAWFIILPIAALASVWMFSNNFKDWQGVYDSVFTYKSYLERSEGSGHEKDWTYYLTLFFWRKDGFVWTEAFMGVLALLGILNILFDDKRPAHYRAWLSFLTVYTLVLLAGYSVIPYKTPWSVLAVSFGFALLGGVGVGALYRMFRYPLLKFLLTVVLAAGVAQLLRQTSLATDYAFPGQTRYAADARNPYAYSHTSPNLVELSQRIHQLANVSKEGLAMPVQIIQSEHAWPLPWYLRDMTHVGYQSEVPAKLDATVIVMDLDKAETVKNLLASQQQVLVDETFTKAVPSGAEAPPLGFPDIGIFPADASQPVPPLPPTPIIYESSLNGLRPGTTLEVWIKKDLWDKLLEQEAKSNVRVRP